MKAGATTTLRRLADAHGIEPRYRDLAGNIRRASAVSLLAALRAIGVPIGSVEEAPGFWREHRSRSAPLVDPVAVVWDGRGGVVSVRAGVGDVECRLAVEGGGERAWSVRGRSGAAAALRLPGGLPIGRHHLEVRHGAEEAVVTVLSAPARVGDERPARELGLFFPLYAVRSARNWGVGDLTDLDELVRWAGGAGCGSVGLLPMLASFLEKPLEPSPYAPVSRLFWNELYIDVEACPEWRGRGGKRSGAGEVGRKLEALCERPLVDYAAAMRVKREALQGCAEAAFGDTARREEIARFVGERPYLEEYAEFRAAVDKRGEAWRAWPARMRAGRLGKSDFEEKDRRYHLYCQCVLHEQLETAACGKRAGLYLDLPIGVHAGGFDTWRFRESFALEASVGAPPDPLGPDGQNWGFPPPHPEASRRDGHAYFAATLRNHLRYSKLLRLDHVMGLHRLFWIPQGIGARDGVYVRYPAEELYAVLSIEAHRAGARIVGENLGTVPPEVNEAMARHGVLGMSVAQFSFTGDVRRPLPAPKATDLACLNTHDTPTFAAFISGKDLERRVELGLMERARADEERKWRRALAARLSRWAGGDPGARRVLEALLRFLSKSPAAVVLVSLEDLWLETEPQNIPGTCGGHNWRRKAGRMLEEIVGDRELAAFVRSLVRERGRSGRHAAGRTALGGGRRRPRSARVKAGVRR